MLKISELQAILTKASNLLGDAPVVLKAIEGDAETFIHDAQLTIGADTSTDGTTLTLNHTTQAPATPTETPAESAPAPPV